MPRSFWKQVKYPEVYRTYPQDVPMKQIVKDIKAGLPVSHMPQYNFPIHILRTSKSVCANHTKHDLVVVVKSGNLGWDARASFRAFMKRQRASYPRLKVGVVFSLGMPRKHGGRIFDRDGNTVRLEGFPGDRMEEYDGKAKLVMERITQEIDQFDDILLGDYEDTYFNLTWKTVTNLRWLSAFCNKHQADAFLIIDDDHRMNLSLVTDFLSSTSTAALRKSIFGYIAVNDVPAREPSIKWFQSYRECPWDSMTPYPRGFSQFIGADIVDDMAIAAAYTRYNYAPEDVFLGMLAFKLGIDLRNEESMYNHQLFDVTRLKDRPPMVALSKFFEGNPSST
ncbi:unnamed protein product [Mesocestoides corti]|uniref:Hexosyltransferase n=1 Tax=Mesocestoides corti TaxID=53468 RepID=A0A3P6HYD6_MESCO|nr:unnamed protein product [Mesocestoides corti]